MLKGLYILTDFGMYSDNNQKKMSKKLRKIVFFSLIIMFLYTQLASCVYTTLNIINLGFNLAVEVTVFKFYINC